MKKMFTTYDQKGKAFGLPFYVNHEGEALRHLQRLVMDQNSLVSTFPEDFDLYELGEYDEATGKMNLHDSPQHKIKAVQLRS